MKKIKIYLQNLKKESSDLKSYRDSNTPSLNKFERVSTFIICLIWVLYFIIGCFSLSPSAAEPISYLGDGLFRFVNQTIPSGYGQFETDQAPLFDNEYYPFVRIEMANGTIYETYSLGIGYRSTGSSRIPSANYITFYDTLSNSNININTVSTSFSFCRFYFMEWNDGVNDTYCDPTLFDSNLINFVTNYCVVEDNPNYGVLYPSGNYYFSRLRNNGLKSFTLLRLLDTDPSLYEFDLEFSYSVVDGVRNQFIYTKHDGVSFLYGRRSLNGYWESDPLGNSDFEPLVIDRPFAIYDPDIVSSFNALFNTDSSSGGSGEVNPYEQGFIDGIEQGFMHNFLNGIFDAFDVFPITENFSLLNLIQSLLGFFILIWLLKLIAGG